MQMARLAPGHLSCWSPPSCSRLEELTDDCDGADDLQTPHRLGGCRFGVPALGKPFASLAMKFSA